MTFRCRVVYSGEYQSPTNFPGNYTKVLQNAKMTVIQCEGCTYGQCLTITELLEVDQDRIINITIEPES